MDYKSMLSDSMEELCGFLTRDAKETVEKIRNAGGRVSSGDVEYLKTLTGAIKNVKTILAMEDYGDGASYDGANGGAMGGGVSGARGRSRVTGRYVSRDGARRRYDERGGMSYDGARDELMEHVDELMGMASDEPTKQMIRRFKAELEKS